MKAKGLIVGQGLAGTLLGWALERAGLDFEIADAGHGRAASRVAAGIINPITGRRLVKSDGIDALMPVARACYREIERAWEVALWREMRVRRWFADERERAVFVAKNATGELAPYVESGDEEGFWIGGAARVDLPALIRAGRERWRRAGVLREERVDFAVERRRYEWVIDCTGAQSANFDFVGWKFSKGECLTVRAPGLVPDVILNRRTWLLPVGGGQAIVGATHEPGVREPEVSAAARTLLSEALESMNVRGVDVIGQDAGVRVYSPDKRPVAGWHPQHPRFGAFNGLGAKGALQAPALAQQWVGVLRDGGEMSVEADVRRFRANV